MEAGELSGGGPGDVCVAGEHGALRYFSWRTGSALVNCASFVGDSRVERLRLVPFGGSDERGDLRGRRLGSRLVGDEELGPWVASLRPESGPAARAGSVGGTAGATNDEEWLVDVESGDSWSVPAGCVPLEPAWLMSGGRFVLSCVSGEEASAGRSSDRAREVRLSDGGVLTGWDVEGEAGAGPSCQLRIVGGCADGVVVECVGSGVRSVSCGGGEGVQVRTDGSGGRQWLLTRSGRVVSVSHGRVSAVGPGCEALVVEGEGWPYGGNAIEESTWSWVVLPTAADGATARSAVISEP
jgi:hypothetical protein